jgi:ubiquinone/menaquinone biosynthesis C-methylase UbiE
MSAFSDLDASLNAPALLAYLDDTDRSMSAFKAYVVATARRYARGERILDLGCGVGHDLVRLTAAGLVPVGVDTSGQALARAAARGTPLARADGARLPFADSVFGGCRVERVLQHVLDPSAVLDEMIRVVRPGGLLAVLEPDYRAFRVDSEVVPDGSVPGRYMSVRHPAIGGQVAELLVRRGCVVDDVVTEQSFGYSLDALPIDAERVTRNRVSSGELDPDVRRAWLDEQHERSRAGGLRATWSKILTVARTPEPR